MQRPKLSIICITYNHEKYINKAIEGFLSQKYKYPIEIIISDDASTDGTGAIINTYHKKFPKIIRPYMHKKNIGVGENLKFALSKARGEYIAMCEGDDYWIDNNKLQIQSDYLDNNKKHTVCFHTTLATYENGERENYNIPDFQGPFTLERLIGSNFMHTSSVVYRKMIYDDIPTDILPLDWYLNLRHAKFGEIGYINRTMSVYRRNEYSVWYPNPNNIDSFWIKRGIGHALMFDAVYELFFNSKYVKYIEEVQNKWTQFLIDLDIKHKAGIIQELCTLLPGSIERYIIIKNEKLNNNSLKTASPRLTPKDKIKRNAYNKRKWIIEKIKKH